MWSVCFLVLLSFIAINKPSVAYTYNNAFYDSKTDKTNTLVVYNKDIPIPLWSHPSKLIH